MTPLPPNLHATAVVLGDRGVLIMGASGAGKTHLALALLEAARANGRFARLIADDQVLLATRGGCLIAATPAPLVGLVEFHGLGPHPVQTEEKAVIDLAVRLVAAREASRYQEPREEKWGGVALPTLDFSERHAAAAARAILAALSAAGPGQLAGVGRLRQNG